MKFSANKKYTFFPNVNGNLELPESERLSVEIIRPTAEERGEIAWYEGTPRGAGTEAAIRTKFDASRILRGNTGVIKNLVVIDEAGKEKAIASGPELAASSFTGMNALVDAICAEVCADYMTEAQKKIFGSPSDCCVKDGTKGN